MVLLGFWFFGFLVIVGIANGELRRMHQNLISSRLAIVPLNIIRDVDQNHTQPIILIFGRCLAVSKALQKKGKVCQIKYFVRFQKSAIFMSVENDEHGMIGQRQRDR